ncbi:MULTISPECIES: hypothetical protein [unclassified Fibrobacter]|uniref:hypothetical protein n=1 Tax=unclassified Fibrobacter TaxID=2634177 RepID=UPI0025B92482|nr:MULTISPECIES: hypothetical protein [unclassified Fibrobacter]
MAVEKHYFQFFNKLLVLITVALSLCMVACSGADGKDGIAGADGRDGRDGLPGTNGKDGRDAVVNLDSLANAIRKEISASLWDSVKTAPNIDTVYKNLFDQAFGEAWMDSTRQALIDSLYGDAYVDSVNEELFDKAFGQAWLDSVRQTLIDSLYGESYIDSAYKSRFDSSFSEAWIDSARQALIDSLKQADYDSLYIKLYDSVYSDIYRQSVIRTLYAEDDGMDEIYGAYANQYSLMYKDFPIADENGDSITIQSPFPIFITDSCNTTIDVCNPKKVMVKTWIPDFTDTITTTGVVEPNSKIVLSPSFKFDDFALYSLQTPKPTFRQVEVYALENDHKILFYSESKSITIHPMQIFSNEAIPDKRMWIGVWVTPMADSISRIVDEVAKKLPDGKLAVYQEIYFPDYSKAINSMLVINAVFEVLQSRNIKYVENDGAGSLGQRVNYPTETLRKKQGICIETAVLFASVLERIGFKTFVIFVPGHAFVGWLADPQDSDMDFVETTMIGDPNATFIDANIEGNDVYDANLEYFVSGEAIAVPIDLLRQVGIMPNNIP